MERCAGARGGTDAPLLWDQVLQCDGGGGGVLSMVLTKQGRGWGAGCSASGYCPVLGGWGRPGQAPAHLVVLLTMATTSSPNTELPRAMADRFLVCPGPG